MTRNPHEDVPGSGGNIKGITLTGDSGVRLDLITLEVSKQFVPVYDKPMIYYPLSTLVLVGISEVLVTTTPHDASSFHHLLGDGSQLGVNISYAVQHEPNSPVQAFVLGTDYVGNDSATLVLGDNIPYGPGTGAQLHRYVDPDGGTVSTYHASSPRKYGVVEFDGEFSALSIEEKPKHPESNYVVPGPYFYNNDVVEIARDFRPSVRDEYEITDVDRSYLETGRLKTEVLPRGTVWLDTGVFDSLADATALVCMVGTCQGMKISAPEEVARHMGSIDDEGLHQRVEFLVESGHGAYLLELLERKER